MDKADKVIAENIKFLKLMIQHNRSMQDVCNDNEDYGEASLHGQRASAYEHALEDFEQNIRIYMGVGAACQN